MHGVASVPDARPVARAAHACEHSRSAMTLPALQRPRGTDARKPVLLAGARGRVVVRRPAPAVVLLVFEGETAADQAGAVFDEIAIDMSLEGPLDLFVDARAPAGASVTSLTWRLALMRHRDAFARVWVLAAWSGSMTTGALRAATGLGEKLLVVAAPDVFEDELRDAWRSDRCTEQGSGDSHQRVRRRA